MPRPTAVVPETPGRGTGDVADRATPDADASAAEPPPAEPADEPAAGPDQEAPLSELEALEAARDEKRQLLERAAREAAAKAPPDGKLPAGCTGDDLPALLQRYYWSEPAAEVI